MAESGKFIKAKVTSVKRGEAMTFLKFELVTPTQINWVIPTKAFNEQPLVEGDQVDLVLKTIQVEKP